MTLRKLCSLFLTALAALLSLVVMGHGLVSAVFIDTRFNPVLSILYCVLPILSFPVFVLARLFRKLVVLQVILLLAWIPVYSALNWRTCASLGYCTTVAATVILTLKTPVVLAFVGVNLFDGAALLLRKIRQTGSNALNTSHVL